LVTELNRKLSSCWSYAYHGRISGVVFALHGLIRELSPDNLTGRWSCAIEKAKEMSTMHRLMYLDFPQEKVLPGQLFSDCLAKDRHWRGRGRGGGVHQRKKMRCIGL
jgi:hypothetical protein